MKTVSEITSRLNERTSKILNEEVFGVDYVRHDTGMVIDNTSIDVIVFTYDNGFIEFQSNIFWTSPLEITPDGNINWGSGPAVVSGTSNEISRLMSYMFEIASDLTKES